MKVSILSSILKGSTLIWTRIIFYFFLSTETGA